MFETVLAITCSLVSLLSIVFQYISKRKLNETKNKIDKELEGYFSDLKDNQEQYEKLSELLKEIEVTYSGLDVKNIKSIDITYAKYLRTSKVLQSIGRASRLKEKQPAYQKLWVHLNSGLINSTLINVMYNDDSSDIDRNSIIGMLVGEKIRKDTKSYIFIIISLVISVAIPIFTSMTVNYWLISFLLMMFSLLVLNQKTLEYRIANGFYGNTQYEAREIISYIEKHASNDDFNGFDNKRIFPKKQHQHKEYKGILGELVN